MQQVDANVQRIPPALPRADWASLAEAAQAIQGSFILQQQLTAQQRAELHRALPQAFLALDASFHDTAENALKGPRVSRPERTPSLRVESTEEVAIGPD